MERKYTIPSFGNSYLFEKGNYYTPTKDGYTHFLDPIRSQVFHFYANKSDSANLELLMTVKGSGIIKASLNGKETIALLNPTNIAEAIKFGYFSIVPGYNRLTITGSTDGLVLGTPKCSINIHSVIVVLHEEIIFEMENPQNAMIGQIPQIEYQVSEGNSSFYAELNVGSHFQFSAQYGVIECEGAVLSLQVGSLGHCSIKFRVESNYKDSDEETYKVRVLRKGTNIKVDECGDKDTSIEFTQEGLSWMKFYTYKFMLTMHPLDCLNNTTEITGSYWDDKQKRWTLIGKVLKPGISTNISKVYSFIENRQVGLSDLHRAMYIGNTRTYNSDINVWTDVNKATFIGSKIKSCRKDMDVSVEDNKFYLEMGGYQNMTPPAIGQMFTRKISDCFNLRGLDDI